MGHHIFPKNIDLRTFQIHTDYINDACAAPNGLYIISASRDAAIKVWNPANGQIIAQFVAEDALSPCAIAADSVMIVAGGISGHNYFLRLKGLDKTRRKIPYGVSMQCLVGGSSLPTLDKTL